MKQRLLCLLLCLALLLTMLPAAVAATEVPAPDKTAIPRDEAWSSTEIWVSGVRLQPGQYLPQGKLTATTVKPSGGYAYWDATGTLTLNNYVGVGETYSYSEYTSCIYRSGDFKIKLIGDNSLLNYDAGSDCITCVNGNLTITGPGLLRLTGDYPIFVYDATGVGKSNLTLQNVTLYALYAWDNDFPVRAIYTDGDLTVKDSTLNLMSTDCGIDTGNMTVANSTIYIYTSNCALRCYNGKLAIQSPARILGPVNGARICTLDGDQFICDSDGDILNSAIIGVPFSDVQNGSYYSNSVYWALASGITTGTSPTTFNPNKTCTRAEAVTFIYRMGGEPEPEVPALPFRDVPVSAYYYDAVRFSVEFGITNGTSPTSFSPNAPCTRAQIITFLWRACGCPEPIASSCAFTDIEVNSFYYDAMMWATQNDITNGTSPTTFSPNAPCTRAQIVTLLHRIYTIQNILN